MFIFDTRQDSFYLEFYKLVVLILIFLSSLPGHTERLDSRFQVFPQLACRACSLGRVHGSII